MPPPRDAAVLRGGGLDRNTLRADAPTHFAVYGFYGLSVWVPDNNHGEDTLLATTLRGVDVDALVDAVVATR
ncbi:MAG: hypothetical protein ACR2LF_03985 [Jatrophihabitantaceae bacterium]